MMWVLSPFSMQSQVVKVGSVSCFSNSKACALSLSCCRTRDDDPCIPLWASSSASRAIDSRAWMKPSLCCLTSSLRPEGDPMRYRSANTNSCPVLQGKQTWWWNSQNSLLPNFFFFFRNMHHFASQSTDFLRENRKSIDMGTLTMCWMQTKQIFHKAENLTPPCLHFCLCPFPSAWLYPALASALSQEHCGGPARDPQHHRPYPLALPAARRWIFWSWALISAQRWDRDEFFKNIIYHTFAPIVLPTRLQTTRIQGHVWFLLPAFPSPAPKLDTAEYLDHTGLAIHVLHWISR